MTNYKEKSDPDTNSKIPFVKIKRRVESIVELQKRNLDSHLFNNLTENIQETPNKKINYDSNQKKIAYSVDWTSNVRPKNNQKPITTSKSKFINDMFARNPFSKDESVSRPITESSLINKNSGSDKDISNDKKNPYLKFQHVYQNGKGYYL
jgi:hypothetical protein